MNLEQSGDSGDIIYMSSARSPRATTTQLWKLNAPWLAKGSFESVGTWVATFSVWATMRRLYIKPCCTKLVFQSKMTLTCNYVEGYNYFQSNYVQTVWLRKFGVNKRHFCVKSLH